MTHGALHVSAIALGAAAFLAMSPLSTASADSPASSASVSAPSGAALPSTAPAPAPSGENATGSVAASTPSAPAPAPSGSTPSLAEPAPTPGWAEAPPSGEKDRRAASPQARRRPPSVDASLSEPTPAGRPLGERDRKRGASTASAPAPRPNASTASLSEPAPTPGWAEAPARREASSGAGASRHDARYPRHAHYAWRNGRHYPREGRNPVASAATGVVGGIADLGSIAAYPIYCFPRYGSCPIYRPYP